MKNHSKIDTAAHRLMDAAKANIPCKPVRDLIGDSDIKAAYAVQSIINKQKTDRGVRRVGRKIGLTSKAVQNQLGVEQPDFGDLFSNKEVRNGWILNWNELMQAKIEAEIAFVLSRDIEDPQIGDEYIVDSIDYVVGSLEIVGSRIEGWNIKITDTIADNASASHFVLGSKLADLNAIDLINCKMEMFQNGKLASSGLGSACLGNPLHALSWLAKTVAELGDPLRKGEIILSGALGPMVAVHPGDEFEARIDGLSSIAVSIGHD